MANSRSNIYPVQLQGAELCLNRYDAEIKQYSGFNKNNSPFVGGCLSNLFTKTETNTTGSSDSVYVDDNGDVYEAKTDGLYKNGEKISSDTWGSPVSIKQLNLPSDTIFVAPVHNVYKTDFFYVRKISVSFNTVTLQFCFRDVASNYNISLTDESDNPVFPKNISIAIADNNAVQEEGLFNFAVRCEGVNNNKVYMVGKVFELLYYPNNKRVDVGNFTFKHNVNESDYIIIPPVVIGNITSFYGADETYAYYGTKYTLSEEGPSSRTTCIGKSKYYFVSGYVAYLLDVTNYTTSGSQSIMIKTQFRFDDENETIVFNKADAYEVYPSASYASGTTLSVKIGKVDNNYDVRGCYALKFSDNKLFYGIAGSDVTDKVTLVEDNDGNKQAMMYMGVIAKQCFLYNNGIVTGVSLNGTLVTEWNSVDGKTLVTDLGQNQEVFYQNEKDKKWYYARLGREQSGDTARCVLRKIGNQIVCNTTGLNSYRVSDGQFLYFAPDWNNRFYYNDEVVVKSGTAITDNAGYMATSINEYNLKDNASLLLNPIPVIKLPDTSYSYPLDTTILNGMNIVNVYSGADGEILYRFSYDTYGKTYNPDLKDLPFPINTSGNVQLSPSLFCESKSFGNDVFIKEGSNAYQLIKDGSESVMSYYLGTLIENLEDNFILQGQYYAIINKQIFNVQFSGGVVQSLSFVVSVENLQFCGNSAYQAYFFSKTNRCIYVFTGANILNQLQLVDKISEVYAYKYNQSTQSIILITDLGTIVSSNLGMYLLEGFTPDDVFFYDKGVVFVSDSELKYLQYYESDGFTKHNIELETCFYGMNNETVTINDCLYLRLFSEEHEEGEVKISATTISLQGRKTENTVFKFRASDWDKLTHSIYVRYQPKEQRGLGISFSIDSPFKIASMSIGSKADAILIDKVSKGAINAPQQTSNNVEW